MNQQIVKKEPNAIVAALDKKQADWAGALASSGTSWDRFRFGVLTALRGNPKLTEAPIADVLLAAGKAVAFGLDVSGMTGEAFLVPLIKNRKVGDNWLKDPTCELWLGVHGVAKLAYRSGMVRLIRPGIVYRGDDFTVDLGDIDRPIRHTPRGVSVEVVAHYAIAALTTGGQLVSVLWRPECDGIVDDARQRLGDVAFSKSPWGTHTDAMLQKTAVKRALKWAPKSVEQQQAADDDDDRNHSGLGRFSAIEYDDGVIDTPAAVEQPTALAHQPEQAIPSGVQIQERQTVPVQQQAPAPPQIFRSEPPPAKQAPKAQVVSVGPPVGDVDF